jgi:FkbM family methyltransferase
MATLYDFGDTGLSTMDKEIAEEHIAAGFKAAELPVPVTTLAAVVDTLGDQQVHFLKIDVEGCERQVLLGANFEKVRPWIVLIEAVRPMTTIPSHAAWEPLLLEAGYEFVYFDGLNRFYVATERSNLKRYFSVPLSICDPFRDGEVVRLSDEVVGLSGEVARLSDERVGLSSEVVRLSDERVGLSSEVVRLSGELDRLSSVNSELRRDLLRHELPRLGSSPQTPIASDADDAVGLQKIVQAQASDLVRLRRALSSVLRESAQRLQIILAVFEWVRSITLGDISRIQEAIGGVKRSRWRRVGQRLGVTRRLTWETQQWQTDVIEANTTTHAPSTAQLFSELDRLHGLLDRLRRSRWQRLGRWLGMVKRPLWESGAWRDPLLIRPFPVDAASCPTAEVRASTSPSSYTGFIEYATERFLGECRVFATDVIFDVGANTGQFAQGLRASGYHGHIISFEPLSAAHATLLATSDPDPLWDVAERCAVGASEGCAEINIAGNSYSSSLLPMLDLHREAAPQSTYQGIKTCRVITLDSYIERTFCDPSTVFGLKIDTQGFEAQVLAGLKRNNDRVKVIICEMSVAPLYAQWPSMSELCHLLAERGYRCVALGPEFEDPRNGELLQVNGVFVRR